MRSVTRRIAILTGILVVASTPAWPAPPDPLTYKLTEESVFEAGCLPPCMCPVQVRQPIRGTFILVPTGFDGLFQNFEVRDVEWVLSDGDSGVHVIGSGTYRFGGEVAREQQLQLDLVVDGVPAQHYDSGLTGITQDFPAIDASVALHGFFCHDSVFRVAAQPSVAAVLDHPASASPRLRPNPFRSHADIGFALPGPGRVDVRIYDVSGRQVRVLAKGLWLGTGAHTLTWDGRRSDGARLPPGVYVVGIETFGRHLRGTLVKY